MNDEFQTQLDHLVWMATVHNQKAYAWHRAQELDKTELYAGIAQALIEKMKQEKTT